MRKVFAIFFVIFLLQGCVSAPKAPFVPATGAIVTAIKAPLTTEFNNQETVKTYGEANSIHVAYYIFNFAIGDASLENAMKEGALKNAAYVDYDWISVLGIFGRLTVRAYGESTQKEY